MSLFPDHIVNLAKSVWEGDTTAHLILADALEEFGLIETAQHFHSRNHEIGYHSCMNANCLACGHSYVDYTAVHPELAKYVKERQNK